MRVGRLLVVGVFAISTTVEEDVIVTAFVGTDDGGGEVFGLDDDGGGDFGTDVDAGGVYGLDTGGDVPCGSVGGAVRMVFGSK